MAEFLKSLNNTLLWAVTILGVIVIFYKKIDLYKGLIILSLLLFVGFISLIIYYVLKLEERVNKLEEKYKRADELKDIRLEVEKIKQKLKIK